MEDKKKNERKTGTFMVEGRKKINGHFEIDANDLAEKIKGIQTGETELASLENGDSKIVNLNERKLKKENGKEQETGLVKKKHQKAIVNMKKREIKTKVHVEDRFGVRKATLLAKFSPEKPDMIEIVIKDGSDDIYSIRIPDYEECESDTVVPYDKRKFLASIPGMNFECTIPECNLDIEFKWDHDLIMGTKFEQFIDRFWDYDEVSYYKRNKKISNLEDDWRDYVELWDDEEVETEQDEPKKRNKFVEELEVKDEELTKNSNEQEEKEEKKEREEPDDGEYGEHD